MKTKEERKKKDGQEKQKWRFALVYKGKFVSFRATGSEAAKYFQTLQANYPGRYPNLMLLLIKRNREGTYFIDMTPFATPLKRRLKPEKLGVKA